MEDGVPILCSDGVTVQEEAEDLFEYFLGMLKVVKHDEKSHSAAVPYPDDGIGLVVKKEESEAADHEGLEPEYPTSNAEAVPYPFDGIVLVEMDEGSEAADHEGLEPNAAVRFTNDGIRELLLLSGKKWCPNLICKRQKPIQI